MDLHAQLDLREFSEALRFVEEVTQKEAPVLLNKAALNVVIGGAGYMGAVQLTPKADAGRIRASLPLDVAVRIVRKRAALAGRFLSRAAAVKAARALIRERQRAAGYTRGPGWSKAARAFGGRGVRTTERFEVSMARFGMGKKASAQDLVAELLNTAPAAEKIGFQALQQAVNNVVRDLVAYGERKLSSRWAGISAG